MWKWIQYTIYCDKIQILKKSTSDKINGTQNALIFLLQCPTLHSFTLKGGLSGVGQFLTTESPFRMMKNAFLFHLKNSVCSQDI